MSIITPSDTALAYLAQLTIGQQRFDISEMSETTGHTATRLGGPPRWTAALRTLDAMEPAVSALWKAISVQLRGRQNHLALYDITQPEPRGSARGVVTLASTAAAGAASLSLAGCVGVNVVIGGSFETDANADGLADLWTRYSFGSTGALSQSLDAYAATHGSSSQYCLAAALGGGALDRNGVWRPDLPCTRLAGFSVTLALTVAGTAGTQITAEVTWKDAGGAGVGLPVSLNVTANGGVQPVSAAGVCPATAVACNLYVFQHSGTGGAAALYVDAVQLVAGPALAGNYAPFATLLAGDWLQVGAGVGSHFCMVSADASASDLGAMTLSIEAPTRKSFASATAVTWDKPKGHYKQRPDSLSWSGAAGSSMVGGFAFDLMEDWTA